MVAYRGCCMARINAELRKELITFLEDKYLNKKGMDVTNLILETLKKVPASEQERKTDDTIALQAAFYLSREISDANPVKLEIINKLNEILTSGSD
jgi:hypothetical protein